MASSNKKRRQKLREEMNQLAAEHGSIAVRQQELRAEFNQLEEQRLPKAQRIAEIQEELINGD